ncbi:MAG: group II intron maturase-specific domain-containing protein [Candidatus Thorarchaeota archaeon]
MGGGHRSGKVIRSCRSRQTDGQGASKGWRPVRAITRRTRGRSIDQIISELRKYLTGWKLYYGIVQVRSMLRELDSWIKRRLRCYLWKQWGKSGYRQLVKLGVTRDLAWNTCKSAHGPWRLSRSPALAFALPARYFAKLGSPSLFAKPT